METVVAFNTELSGLYESKPPISKAKMTSITRSAMKAIKFYKHVVQSVEKFILKCKQEYKIPGLYVIDSIVRQSRHQFGTEKDVFAPRFARNMQSTFANLFQCSPEDKSKIIRVLNLWQKNNVFAPEVIQPLFDLADPNHPIYQNQGTTQDANVNGLLSSIAQESPAPNMADEGHTMSSDMSGPINSMSNVNQYDPNTIRQLQQLQQMLIRQKNNEPVASTSSNSTLAQDSVKFNKKLLDFDYGDDDDDDKNQSPRQSQMQQNSTIDNSNISQLLSDPNVLRQLHNLQKLKQMEEKQSKLAEMRMQEEAFEKQLATMLKKLPFANECDLSRQENPIYGLQSTNVSVNQNGPIYVSSNIADQAKIDPDVELVSDDGKVEVINLDGNSRSPSIDRDRYKRRRSRSRSRDRRRRRSRSRSRSRSNRRRGSSRDRDRGKDKEKERERKRKGLPEIKKEHLSVCSTTLWIGHLSKLTQQEELSDTFAKYGDIVSIDMIHPRGCAFLVMHRRQDAYKAIDGLSGYKLHGRVISISWAAGKGVKSKEWKDYWDLELGVSYIPWSKLDESTDFDQLEEGGMFDEDTMPPWLKEKLKNQSQKKDTADTNTAANQVTNIAMFGMDTTQPPPTQQMMANVPQMVPPFPMGPVPRFMPPMNIGMAPNIYTGVPPPMNGQMMIPQQIVPGMPPQMLDKPPPGAAPYMSYFPPPIPQMPPIPQAAASTANSNINDDQMDIEMEDEVSVTKNNSLMSPVNMFNRPPPNMFGKNAMQSSSTNDFANKDRAPGFDDLNNDRANNSASSTAAGYDRDKDFRGRGRERERDNRNRSGNRDNRRNDYSSERTGDRNSNTRWSEARGRSRENDRTVRQNSRDRNDRSSADRNDGRDKLLQDRIRNISADGNNRDFNNQRNNMQWRDAPPANQMNFNNNFIDQANAVPPRPMAAFTGAPPALEDIRIPIPLESLRGMPIGPMAKGHHGRGRPFDFNRGGDDFDRRQLNANQQGRDYFNQNRFGPPGNAPPMMRGNMQQFGHRNNNPMFMWQSRAGLNNNDRPEGNFNRGDRRGNANQRGSRHWKDNEESASPHKMRNNRSFDGQKDGRKPRSTSIAEGAEANSSIDLNESQNSTLNSASSNSAEPSDDPKDVANVEKSGEEKAFPRIQIKSPSKLAQEFCEKQKQSSTDAESTAQSTISSNNDSNRTNNIKSAIDLNTTPLYDEPAENRSYSVKENPNHNDVNQTTSHSFDIANSNPTLSSPIMEPAPFFNESENSMNVGTVENNASDVANATATE